MVKLKLVKVFDNFHLGWTWSDGGFIMLKQDNWLQINCLGLQKIIGT